MTEDEKRHFEVMLEEINHHVKIIAEGHDVLHGEIRTTREHLEEKINQNTAMIKHVHVALSAKIDGVEQRLGAKIDRVGQRLEAKIDGVEQRLRKDMQEMGASLTGEIRAVGDRSMGIKRASPNWNRRLSEQSRMAARLPYKQ